MDSSPLIWTVDPVKRASEFRPPCCAPPSCKKDISLGSQKLCSARLRLSLWSCRLWSDGEKIDQKPKVSLHFVYKHAKRQKEGWDDLRKLGKDTKAAKQHRIPQAGNPEST